MSSLAVQTIQTRIFRVGDALIPFLKEQLLRALNTPSELEGKVLVITSKIVSLSEGRIISKDKTSKEELVRAESDVFLGEIGYGCFLTIKHGLFIPSAGIDESNAEGDFYILYPKNPFETANEIRNALALEWGLKNFGVLLSDSKTTPLRAGVTGVALAHAGFKGVRDHVGAPDLFDHPLKMTRVNVADAIAVAAVYCMGEANESTPLALVSGGVEFSENASSARIECLIQPELDLYRPLYKEFLDQL